MSIQTHTTVRREQGIALLVTVVTLLIATMIGLTALQQTQEESTAGGRARATARTLQAADAGIQFAVSRLSASPPNLNAFSLNLANGVTVESRKRTQGSAQDITEEVGGGSPPEGYAINIGGGTGVTNRLYRVTVTATGGPAVAEIETLIGRPEAGGS